MIHSRTRFMTTVVTATSFLFINMVYGADQAEPLELKPDLVITAARAPEDASQASGSVTVITSEDLRLSVAEDLLEILRLQPGIDVVRTGGPGAQTSVFMRGSNSNHVLVLIDGIRVASPHTGAYAWELLPLNQVERVEIVRGPRASLYGSDAIGGVVQVFTRKQAGQGVRITAGSDGATEFEGGLGLGGQRSRTALNAAYRQSDGFSSQNPGGYSFHPDDDGFESLNIGINGALDAGGGTLGYLVLASDSETEFDEGVSDASQLFAALSWTGVARDGWDYQLQASLSDEELESDFGFFSSDFDSRRYEISWQNRLRLERGNLAFGLDYFDDSGASAGSYDESRHNTGAYLLWSRPLSRADLQMSARLDDNSEFGSEFTWQAAAGMDIGESGRLSGLAGTAFRAPGLSEQFSPGFGGLFRGNPLLGPETSETLELIYRHGLGSGASLLLSVYETRVDDLISFTGPDFGAVNVNRARMQGLELEYALSTELWQLNAGITVQDTEDRSTGASLLRRPDEKAAVSLVRRFANGAWAGGDWFVSGERFDVGNQRLPGYGIVNLRGGVGISKQVQLEVRLENILDRDYEPAAGFNSSGRAGFVSLNWRN